MKGDEPERDAGSSVPDPIGYPHRSDLGKGLAASLRGLRPAFVCVVAHTDTCLIPGISAAGATADLRPLTPAADAEALCFGRARCLAGVPSNPLGPPGPALITVAALQLAPPLALHIVDAGTRVRPQTPAIVLGTEAGRSIITGEAVPAAAHLFEHGRRLGQRLAAQADYLVLGESVPGGTTTALAVLLGLGYPAAGKVSSSLGENAHELKAAVVREALAASDLPLIATLDQRQRALEVLARVGDPMQPALAGIALGALERRPVLLAGGTQMIAVLAVMRAIARQEGRDLCGERLALATTRWVVDDPTSDFAGLLSEVAPVPAVCTNLSFATSRHAALRRYEEFLVKEGVGAGGAAVAASLTADVTLSQLLGRIEDVFEQLSSASGVAVSYPSRPSP